MPEEERQHSTTENFLQQPASLQHNMQNCCFLHNSVMQLQFEEMPRSKMCTRSYMFWLEAVNCKHLLKDSV